MRRGVNDAEGNLPRGKQVSRLSSCAGFLRVRNKIISLSPRSVAVLADGLMTGHKNKSTCIGDKKEPHSWTNFVKVL